MFTAGGTCLKLYSRKARGTVPLSALLHGSLWDLREKKGETEEQEGGSSPVPLFFFALRFFDDDTYLFSGISMDRSLTAKLAHG